MGRFSDRVATVHCTTVKQSVMGLPLWKFGLATRLRKISASVISSTCPRSLKSSCVFPNTQLFINMKYSFRKLLPANERCWLLKSIFIGQIRCEVSFEVQYLGILLAERVNTYHDQSPPTRGRMGSRRESRVTGVNSGDPLPLCSLLQHRRRQIAPPPSVPRSHLSGGIDIRG